MSTPFQRRGWDDLVPTAFVTLAWFHRDIILRHVSKQAYLVHIVIGQETNDDLYALHCNIDNGLA